MDEDEYNLKFLNEKTWCCVLSDGSTCELLPNGNDENVTYADRLGYIELVRQTRMSEADKQVRRHFETIRHISSQFDKKTQKIICR
jgi:hypothetical protein